MLSAANRFLFIISRYAAYIGMIFLLGAMLITSSDVILRKCGFSGIYGAIDLIQLMVMGAAYLSIPYAFITRSHVAVTILADKAGRRGSALMQVFAAVLGMGFMFAIAWYGYFQAAQQAEYGDVSMTFGLPMTYYWMPLLFGAALSTVITLLILLEAVFTLATGRGSIATDDV